MLCLPKQTLNIQTLQQVLTIQCLLKEHRQGICNHCRYTLQQNMWQNYLCCSQQQLCMLHSHCFPAVCMERLSLLPALLQDTDCILSYQYIRMRMFLVRPNLQTLPNHQDLDMLVLQYLHQDRYIHHCCIRCSYVRLLLIIMSSL